MGDIGPDAYSSVWLWDVASRRLLSPSFDGHHASVRSPAYSPDGHLIATGDDWDVRLWDPASHRQFGVPLSRSPGAGPVTSLAFSPDGRLLAAADLSRSVVTVWDVAARTEITELAGVGFWAVAFSPDGRPLATGGDAPGKVRIWDVTTWHQVGDQLPVDAVDLAFSPDGRTLATVAGSAGGYPDRVWLWDVPSHRQLPQLSTGDPGGVYIVAFSPDGRLLATGGDGTIRFWNPTGHQPVGPTYKGRFSNVNTIAFSPDGTLLASGAIDGSTRLWHVPR